MLLDRYGRDGLNALRAVFRKPEFECGVSTHILGYDGWPAVWVKRVSDGAFMSAASEAFEPLLIRATVQQFEDYFEREPEDIPAGDGEPDDEPSLEDGHFSTPD